MAERDAVERPAFEVINSKTGHRYAIYASGAIEGFGPDMIIVNRIACLVSLACAEGYAEGKKTVKGVLVAVGDTVTIHPDGTCTGPPPVTKGRPDLLLCSRCGKPGAHFVPPSLGEAGFYVCEDI